MINKVAAGGLAAGILASVLSWSVQAQEAIRISVGIDAAYVSMYIAKRDGLFEKHGVNVELEQFAGGGLGMDTVVAGLNQMAAAAEPTTMIRMARADVRSVAVLNDSHTYVKLVTRADISAPGDIRKLGLMMGSVGEYVTQLMIQEYNLDSSSIELIGIEPPEAAALLARGDIDGFFFWEPWPTYGLQQGGQVRLTNGELGYIDGIWLSATAAWLDGHQTEVQNILAALAEACQIANDDPERAIMAVVEEAKLDPAIAQDLIAQRTCDVPDFTDTDMESYTKIAQFLADKKITPELIDLDVVIDRGFYKPAAQQ